MKNEALLIFGMVMVTFGVRYPVLAFFSRLSLPGWIQRGLHYVPPAVLSALIVPALLMPGGSGLQVGIENPYLMGGIVAILVSWWRKNLLWTILAGMLAFLGFRWLLGVAA